MNLKNMDLKLPYTKDYELDDDFITSLEKAPPSLSFTIALYLEEYLPDLPPNDMCTHLTAGLVYHFNEPVPFILEVMRPDKYLMVLTQKINSLLDGYGILKKNYQKIFLVLKIRLLN